MRNRVTLADVAKAAGVNAATVSRSLNPATESQVSKETARKIKKIAKELGYTPNTVARGLRTRKSLTIGVVIPDLTNPIFPPIVRGIDSYLIPRGYSAFVVNTDGNHDIEQTLISSLMERQVDGLIVATGHTEGDLLTQYHQRGVKVVMVNRESPGIPFPAVTSDDSAGISAIIEHLVTLGHKNFIHLAGPTDSSTGLLRSRTFTSECKRLGLTGKVIKNESYSIDDGQAAVDKLLDHGTRNFTAIVAGNDLLALGAYHSLRTHGLKCPEDVSVVGFNNMPFTADFQPPMTTVNAPHFDMGVEAARLLLSQIDGIDTAPVKVTLPVSLIVRGSTASAL
ncbi:MAG: LacI family DNA-binding transcriptional regulator [Actinomycetes bacterium]